MFVYYGKRFDASSVGSVIIGVRCDKCACEYYYELSRVGSASRYAHYGIGSGRAMNSAQDQSEEALQERLSSEAELVPCPKCNWINEELVRGYAKGTDVGCAPLAIIGGFVILIIPLLIGLIIRNGPPRDLYLAPWFLNGGPIAAFVFVAVVFLLRIVLGRRIDPNHAYPAAPELPPGTPPALYGDPSSGKFWPAKASQAEKRNDEWREFQVGRTRFPLVCCECLKPATTEHAFKIAVAGQSGIEIPRCAACAGTQVLEGKFLIFLLAAIGMLAAGMTLAFWKFSDVSCPMNCALLTLFFIAVGIMAAMTAPSAPVESMILDTSRGVVGLRFKNKAYEILIDELERANENAKDSETPKIDTSITPDRPPPSNITARMDPDA